VTSPFGATLIYLYWIIVPGAKEIVASHRLSEEVYSAADIAYASSVSQFPRIDTSPAILIVSPYVVVTISSNVTATDVAAAQVDVVLVVEEGFEVVVVVVVPDPPPPGVVVVELPPEIGVWLEGQEPVDAVEYVPIAEVEEQTDGTLEAVGSPQE